MEFDFLPKLPKANLDDRTFQDLVEECILRIPRYCPEWTNYNPGDPGITLVELFAWLTDQMLLRFNQVPRRNYVLFLELLGIRLQPAAPAQTELTFYLSAALPHPYQIAPGTEVATVRTETEEAIVFSTDHPLTIGIPQITHFLTANQADPQSHLLRDRLTNLWTQQSDGSWEGREQPIFEEQPKPDNCFYVILDPTSAIAGNVIALTLKGEAATSTGINPDHPPRIWDAWDGQTWQPILLQEADDNTRGFSFDQVGQPGLSPVQEADVILHLPLQFPPTHFVAYYGRWLRCRYATPMGRQTGYSQSPQLVGMAVRAIGGTIPASQCSLIRNELVGVSDGTPGQRFRLQSASILPRQAGEHVVVVSPTGLTEVIWQEVQDFADSGPQDRHYILDSITGEIQFGPLIREPAQLREQVEFRARTQVTGEPPSQTGEPALTLKLLERQYGAIPPRGAQIRMAAYRTGGGQRGNVQIGTLSIPKTAIPYVDRVINHIPARNGADAESLDNAVIRVPQMLRTRDRAVTPEDFETLAQQGGQGSVARVRCLPPTQESGLRGVVNLLIVPQANTESIGRAEGIHPQQLRLTPPLQEQVLDYLNDRRLLGVQVQLQEPQYVGVSVQAEVGLDPDYNHPQAQQVIVRSLQVALYRFLNPLTGGLNGKGWDFGCPVYQSDIISLLQTIVGVRYLGAILLYELRPHGNTWERTLAPNGVVDPGAFGLVCSWADRREMPQAMSAVRSGHAISLIG